MTKKHQTSDNSKARKPKATKKHSSNQYLPDSELALDSKIAQNPEPLSQKGSKAMRSIPDNVPGLVDLYFQRFFQANLREDIFAVIDEIWHKDCPLSFDEKLEAIRKIIVWDDFNFNVDSYPLWHFQACQEAVRETCYHSHQGDVNKFLIENLESMNYAAKKTTIDTCLLGVEEAKETIERVLENSTEWEIIQACKSGLRSIYRKYYPEEMHKINFDIADRVDLETKRNPERANTIKVITVTEEMQEDFRRKRETQTKENKGLG